MAKKQAEPMILLPYSQIIELMEVANCVKELKRDIERLSKQQGALRGQFYELMERFRELE